MKYRLSNGLLIVGMALCMIVTIHSFLLIGAIIDAVHAHEKYALTEAYHIGNSDIELVDVSEGNYYEKVPHNLTQSPPAFQMSGYTRHTRHSCPDRRGTHQNRLSTSQGTAGQHPRSHRHPV